ncbi:MAG: hypothetical protein HYT27_01295 [Parcubacteria group bacterium]|nr:hypothetical protein [Parcubacteria group bacterium]
MPQKTVTAISGKQGSGKETVGNKIAENIGEEKVCRATFSGPLTDFLLDMGYRKEEIDRPLLQWLGQRLVKRFRKDAVTCGILNLIQKTDRQYIVVDGVRWPSDFAELKKPENLFPLKTVSAGRRLWRVLRARIAYGSIEKFLEDMGYPAGKIDRELVHTTALCLITHFGDDFFTKCKRKPARDASVNFFMIFVDVSPKERYERLRDRKQRAGEEDLTWEEFLKQDSAPNEAFIPELAKMADFTIDNEERDPALTKLKKRVGDICLQCFNIE